MDTVLKALRERANLFRHQYQGGKGSNIFDQAAREIERLMKDNRRLQGELVFTENMIKMFAAIEPAEIPADAIDMGVAAHDVRDLVGIPKDASTESSSTL